MRFEALLSFYTAVEEGSFTAAAKKLFLTQPAVSMAIKQLEAEYGQPLIIRKPGGGIEVTSLGDKVYRIVKDIRASMETLERLKHEHSRQLQHEIVIECDATAGVYLLSLHSSLFRDIHPEVNISIKHTKTGDSVQNILDGKCDLVMLLSHEQLTTEYHSKLQAITTWEDQLEIIVPKDHPLANQTLPSSELGRLSFILPVKNSPTRRILNDSFKTQLGFLPQCVIEVDNPEAIKQSVLSLYRPGIVLRSTVQRELDQAMFSPVLSELNFRCKHMLAHKKHHFQPGAVKLFANYVTNARGY